MTPRTSSPRQDPAVSRAIDAIIKAPGDWRSTTLARLRAVILSADASIVEEVKWKKPSRPAGVSVWSRDGNICIVEALKSAVRLTFPKGALLEDPEHVFNTRLDSATVRAVDVREGDMVNEAALRALIRQAAKLNASKAGTLWDAQTPVRAVVGRTHRSSPEPHHRRAPAAPGAIMRRAGQRPRTCPAAIRPASNAVVPVVTTGSCAAKSRSACIRHKVKQRDGRYPSVRP